MIFYHIFSDFRVYLYTIISQLLSSHGHMDTQVRLSWTGMGRRGLGWHGHGLAWAGLAWVGLAWDGLAWVGLAWAGLAWAGLAWLGWRRLT